MFCTTGAFIVIVFTAFCSQKQVEILYYYNENPHNTYWISDIQSVWRCNEVVFITGDYAINPYTHQVWHWRSIWCWRCVMWHAICILGGGVPQPLWWRVGVNATTVEMYNFSMLGRILSHGFFIAGFLPLHITFPCLATMLLGHDQQTTSTILVSDDILMEAFSIVLVPYGYSCHQRCPQSERSNLQTGDLSKIVSIMSRYESRVLPTPIT